MTSDDPRATTAAMAGQPFPDLTEPERLLEREWQEFSNQGYRAFARGEFGQSVTFHREALSQAETLFDLAWRGGTPFLAPMLYNVSSSNLTDAIEAEGKSRSDGAHLSMAYDKLVTTAASPICPLALRINCLRHLRWNIGLFARQVDAGWGDPRVEAMLARAATIARQVSVIVLQIGVSPADCVPAMHH